MFNWFDLQGDIFSGLNDGILSRAEALADIGKHQSSHAQMSSQLKHDVMYHHSMGGPPQRPLQVSPFISKSNIRNTKYCSYETQAQAYGNSPPIEFHFIQFEYEFQAVCIPMRSHFSVEMRLTDQKNQYLFAFEIIS